MNMSSEAPLTLLAGYLVARRESLLNNWRTVCQKDPGANTVANLSREEFNNKAPFMLNVLHECFQQKPLSGDIRLLAAEHGLHRWQKGYSLSELLIEIHHMNTILLDELRQFWHLYPTSEVEPITLSYEYVSWFSAQSYQGSVEQYTELQRREASNRVVYLEQAFDDLNELTRQRSDLLRTTSHDLRGSFGIIQGAASYLNLMEISEPERKQTLEMLNRNLKTVRDMVIQLMDLSRLEAGQEPVNIQSFDAGQLLHKLVESYQPLAEKVGLVLKADGPSELIVESDPLHLQRIVQNLVLNALKHTDSGWVSISWTAESNYRWIISVQDSGPGLPHQQAGAFSQVLSPTPESNAAFGIPNPEADAQEEANIQADLSSTGEGIGLSIVKRLCELLRASLEIETQTGTGTLFRIRLALHWKS
ncbi:hypothetical protein GCM10027347_26870 [Larkinella harenae]